MEFIGAYTYLESWDFNYILAITVVPAQKLDYGTLITIERLIQ